MLTITDKIKGRKPSFDTLVAVFEGPLHYSNAIRRVITAEIPALAIDLITIENSSSYPDELIMNKLAMLPIDSTVALKMKKRGECSDCYEGCDNCRVVYNLDKKGPCTVMSGDLIGKVPLTDNEIPIITLEEGQSLKVEAFAIIGTAFINSKWKTAHVGFSHSAKLVIPDQFRKTVDNDKEMKKRFIDCFPNGMLNDDLSLHDEFSSDFVERYLEQFSQEESITDGPTVVRNENRVQLTIEGLGYHDPKIILTTALTILRDKFRSLLGLI